MWRREVWVDLAKSQVDPEAESPESPEPRAQSPEPRAQSPEPRELSEEQSLPSSPLSKKSDGATSMESEMCYARKLCLAAKSQVMDMFQEARQGRRPKHDVAAGRRNRCLGAAPTSCPHQRRTHQNARRLHLPALGCRLRPDAIAGPASRSERGANAPGWHRRTDARPGKAAMPLEVLNKPGKLTDAEFAIMKRHPVEGAKMLRAGGAEPGVVDIALHHHEKIDGTGYPDRLAGDAISLLARMGAICDVYDAVTSERAYKSRGTRPRRCGRWPSGRAISTNASSTPSSRPWASTRRLLGSPVLSASGRCR